jgi:hypothetical protein
MKDFGLFINTSQKENQIFLINNFKIAEKLTYIASDNLENQFFENLKRFLEKNRIKFTDLKFLVVFCGPGGFTGTRIAISFANAAKLSIPKLNIFDLYDDYSVQSIIERIGKEPLKNQILTAKYYKEPSITKMS